MWACSEPYLIPPSREAPSRLYRAASWHTAHQENSEAGSPSAAAGLKESDSPLGAQAGPSDSQQMLSHHPSASILGLSYIPLVFMSRILLRGFTDLVNCGTNIVPGALLLLLPFPHYYPREGHQFFHRNPTNVGTWFNPSLSKLYTA
jgi:hypothetical protein